MMQKSRKVYSSGLVPGYQHPLDTMAESEGFGSSGRAEQELTASEDSCGPERNYYDLLGVPTQILSLSGMSILERRDLKARLRDELERIRMFHRKLFSVKADSTVFPPTFDVLTNRKVPKVPAPMENLPVTMSKGAMSAGKKKFHPGRNKQHKKSGATSGRRCNIINNSAPRSTSFDALMKQCEALLKQLVKQKNAWLFNKPVDIVELNIPDYFNIIKQPMDLGTVKVKLLSHEYPSPMEFAADVRLTFKNAMTYNSPGNAVHFYAITLSKFFESRWKVIEKKVSFSADDSTPSKSSVVIEPGIASIPPAKKRKLTSDDNKVIQKTDQRVMSDLEKQKMSADLEALLEELPENIIDVLKESSLNGSQVDEDEIEIDVYTLSDKTLFLLRKHLDEYLVQKKKKLSPSKIEVHNESGYSNTYMEPHNENNDPADEDVDIDAINPPTISMEIDKDATQRISKSSSSSSSSSESSSSSSGSDSEGSSGEADDTRDLVQPSISKEEVASKVETKNSDINDPNDGVNGNAEQNPPLNLAIGKPSGHQEGESAPQDRQVSPDKLYRAAILRCRFADIIIKAQENNLDKGERQDLEKMKLEKWRKEEKARLQAEARDLEEDRKKAEAEAAAEAKRKIEMEREAARQALHKMEKTVDIDENSQFMEDLELFTSAPDENVQGSFMEDMSPENSQNGLGSFKFQNSSNPLEQLGLFMKNDDEEKGDEPQSNLASSNDPPMEKLIYEVSSNILMVTCLDL